jgi:VWFA-related protein
VSAGDTQLNILLFDMLNTPPQDQAYARDQMLRCLRSLSKGKYLTLFILGTHLQMLQTSTDNPEALAKSVEKLVRQNSPLLTTEAQQQQDQGFTEEIGRHAAPTLPSQAPASAQSASKDAAAWIGSVSQRTATSSRMEAIRSDERTTMTLDALGAIARAVSGFPGRKNLVWLSGSFKIRIRPSDNTVLGVTARTTAATSAVSDQSSTFSYQEAIRQLSIQLAAARIAVYPVDVRGLTAGGVNIAVSAESSESMVNPANNDNYSNTLNGQSETRYSEHNSMHDLAEQTGGHAFFDNDVQGSIVRSLDDGSTYYTLAYAPEKGPDNKSFRKVEIKLNRPAVLAYRAGYYPNSSQESFAQSGAHLLAAAMQPGLPQSTMVPVTLRVTPPDANSKSVRLDYTIDLSAVEFVETADNRQRALIDCMAVALDANGNIAAQTANTMDVTLGSKELAEYQRTGLPAHQELALPPGKYDLRLGILERGSQKIGTIDTSLLVPLANAAKN